MFTTCNGYRSEQDVETESQTRIDLTAENDDENNQGWYEYCKRYLFKIGLHTMAS